MQANSRLKTVCSDVVAKTRVRSAAFMVDLSKQTKIKKTGVRPFLGSSIMLKSSVIMSA